MRERGGWYQLTDQDHARIKAEEEDERAKARSSAPWRKASLTELRESRFDLPRALVEGSCRESNDFLPPDLSEEQKAEVDELIEYVQDDLRPAGREATAVILHRLASVVIVPDSADIRLAMEIYLEELSGYPEHLLDSVVTQWWRTEKFWPTIADLRKACQEHEDSVGRTRASLRKLYALKSVGAYPATDLVITSHWLRGIEADARAMANAFDRFRPRKRIETDKAPKLAIAS